MANPREEGAQVGTSDMKITTVDYSFLDYYDKRSVESDRLHRLRNVRHVLSRRVRRRKMKETVYMW